MSQDSKHKDGNNNNVSDTTQQTDTIKPTVKFKSKNKSNKSTARSNTVLDRIVDNDSKADDSNNELSIDQIRLLQQYRATQPVIQHTTKHQSNTTPTSTPSDPFEASIDEKIKIKQMNAYIESQLKAQQLLNNINNTNNTLTTTDQYKEQLYSLDHTIAQKLSQATVPNTGKDAEKGYNWLAGIAEIPLSDTERQAMIHRNEAVKRQLQQETAEVAKKQIRDDTVANYNSNYTQHKKEYIETKKAKRDGIKQTDNNQ